MDGVFSGESRGTKEGDDGGVESVADEGAAVSLGHVDITMDATATNNATTTTTTTTTAAAATTDKEPPQLKYVNGVTSLSWDRRSRTLLAGSIGDRNLRLMDNTHPQVSLDCVEAVRRQWIADGNIRGAVDAEDCLVTPDNNKRGRSRNSFSMMSPTLETVLETPSSSGKKSTGDGTDLDTEMMERVREEETMARDGAANVDVGGGIPLSLETVSFGKVRLLRSALISAEGQTKPTSSCLPLSLPVGSATLTHSQPLSMVKKALSFQQSDDSSAKKPKLNHHSSPSPITVPITRHSTLVLELPKPLGGPSQLHPRDCRIGMACMSDCSLALFFIPPMAFYETLPSMIAKGTETDEKIGLVRSLLSTEEANRAGNVAYLVPPQSDDASGTTPQYSVTCGAFGKDGDILYAGTKCGTLLGFNITQSMMKALRGESTEVNEFSAMQPSICVKIPGGGEVWQIIASKNGKLLINSADCALRLYDTDELRAKASSSSSDDAKPLFLFQDTISKAPFGSCDVSGDGEYVVGGCNSYPQAGENYKLYLWNTVTGELEDTIAGPPVELYSLSCHPTRPFIAAATSDGLVDIWGPRMDWISFAPDFQALKQNSIYEEREDEFDVVVDNALEEGKKGDATDNNQCVEDEDVDINTVEKVPAFDSDSEDENDVFKFDYRVLKILSDKSKRGEQAL